MENSKQSAEIEGSICDLEQMNLTDFALDDFVAKENSEASEIEKIKADLVEMKNEMESMKLAHKFDLNEMSSKLEAKIESLGEYVKDQMQKLSEEKKKYQEEKLSNMDAKKTEEQENGIIAILEKEIDRVWHQMNIANEENAKLREEVVDLKQKNSEIAKENKPLDEKMAQIEVENRKLKEEIHQKDEELAKMEGKISNLNDKIAKLNNEICKMDNKLVINDDRLIWSLKSENYGKNHITENETKEIYEKDEKISALEAENAELKQRMKEMSKSKIKPPMWVRRPSIDQRQPIKLAQIQQDALSKKSENAWKSKREEYFDMNERQKDEDEDDAKYEKLKKEIRGLLNKITSSTYEDLSNDFCAYKFNDDPKLLTSIVDLIFDKVMEEPQFCPLYADLCKKQVAMEMLFHRIPDEQQQFHQQKNSRFRNGIILKCQRTFSEYYKKMNELEEKLKGFDESGEKGKAQIEEELEMSRSKEKQRLLGTIKFIGQLYRHEFLVEMVIDWCAIELIKWYQATQDEVYIEYTVELIETIGKIYEQRKEQALQKQINQAAQALTGLEQKSEYRLDMVFSHLSHLKANVSNRIRFAILNLEDLRKNNWAPCGGEGPKIN